MKTIKKFVAGLGVVTLVASSATAAVIASNQVVPDVAPIVNNINSTKKKAAPVVDQTEYAQYVRDIIKIAKSDKTITYGGLSYVNGDVDHPKTSPTAATDKVLILYDIPYYEIADYSGVDFTAYKALEDVILVSNNYTLFGNYLKLLTSGVNLYVSGSQKIGSLISGTVFKNVYLIPGYEGKSDVGFSSFFESLAASNIENFYYNALFKQTHSSELSALTGVERLNKNSTAIKFTELKENVKYPKEIFDVLPGMFTYPHFFGHKTHYRAFTDQSITDSSMIMEVPDSIDPSVKSVQITAKDYSEILKDFNYETLSIRYPKSYDFTGIKAKELILPCANLSIDMSKFNDVESLRFTRASGSLTVSNATIPGESKLKKIYIPSSEKERFSALTSDSTVSAIVEYYDLGSWEAPLNSYLASDGKTIYCSITKYSIEELEAARKILDARGIDYSNAPVDKIMRDYELPIVDDSIYGKSYYVSDIDLIILPKNVKIDTVIARAGQYLLRNHSAVCLDDGFNITVDKTGYKDGFTGNVKLNITYPDGKKETKETAVRVLPENGDICYFSFGNSYLAVTKVDKKTRTLEDIYTPLMQNYLMENSVAYTQSPVFDTTVPEINCNNYFKGSGANTKARVLTLEEGINEATPAPNPEPNPDQPGGGGSEGTPEVNPNDTDGVDTEGIVLNEVQKVYTPTTIDGKFLFSQLKNHMCTKNGEPYRISYGIGFTPNDNTQNYTFTILTEIAPGDKYRKKVECEIIKCKYNIGFVVFADGTIAVEHNLRENYTPEQIKEAIVEFLTLIGKPTTDIVIPASMPNTQVYEGSYAEGKLLIVNSGVNLTYTDENKPIDDSEQRKGVHAFSEIWYSSNYTIQDVLYAMADKMIYKDGVLLKDYTITFKTVEETKGRAYFDVKVGDEVIIKQGEVNLRKVESKYNFMFGHQLGYEQGTILFDICKTAPKEDLSTITNDILSNFRTMTEPFKTTKTVDFTKESHADLDGTYQLGNAAYYKYEYDFDVVDIEKEVSESTSPIDGKLPEKKNFFSAFAEKFKTLFENNIAFKASMIVLGTILGAAILYGLYALIRKLIRWLK